MIQKVWNFLRPKGRHNLVLRVAGTYFVVNGISLHFYVPDGPRWNALVIARSWMPLDYWGYVFMLVGSLVIASAVRDHKKTPGGYALLTGLASAWSAFYFLGLTQANDPETNISLGFVWALNAFVWWAISGLINPDPYQSCERRTDESAAPRSSKLDET